MEVQEDQVQCHPHQEETKMSKRQMKRLAKHQKWLANKPIRRVLEKEKRKKRKAAIREQGLIDLELWKKPPIIRKMSDSTCRLRIAIDIAFDHLMTEQETSDTCKQIQRCYSANRRIKNPVQLYITNFLNESKEKLLKVGCSKWDVNCELRSCFDCFEKEEIVYLTSESSNVIDLLDDSKVYVIGGIVDHNKHKGLCLSLAEEHGVAHAQLPIGKFISMNARKVLPISHVFEILIDVAAGMSWANVLMKILPQRKQPTLLVEKSGHSQQEGHDMLEAGGSNLD